ncbi:MAG: Hsp20/alpha crystallin family protein [Candidatus Kapabacteria bacterium]|jgi:HSP20 family protein|nr:Hsp20/alpha crystallin family protein [Candidatus Kapabacteria bacterium]
MTYLRFDPFKKFDSMTRKMNEYASEFEKGFTFESGAFNPKADISESSKEVVIYIELPGMSKTDVKISINEDRMLTVSGDKNKNDNVGNKRYVRSERSYGEFSRSFMLAENVGLEDIDAKFEEGVLVLKLAKIEPAKPKVIDVEIK